MKIKKFSGGGTPYVFWNPPQIQEPNYPPAPNGVGGSSKEDEYSGLLTKELEKEILKGGLNNETMALVSELKQLESKNMLLGKSDKNDYYDLMGKIIVLKNNKEFHNKAITQAEKSGGLNEVAISRNGGVYVEDKDGKLQLTSVQKLKQNPRSGRALTVAEVMEKRNTDASLIYRNDLFDVANNSVGMKTITTHIYHVVNALGKERSKESSIYNTETLEAVYGKGYREVAEGLRQPNESELRGFNVLNKVLNSPSNYNQITNITETERNHADKALNYIWSTLDQRAQTKLSVQAALNNQNPIELIQSALMWGTDKAVENDIKPLTDPRPKDGSGNKSNSKPASKSLTELETFLEDTDYDGKARMNYNEIFEGSSISARYPALGKFAQVGAEKQESLGAVTVDEFMLTGWNKLVESDKVTFGKTKVHISDLNNIFIDGQSNMWKVIAPKNYDGTVNNDLLESFESTMDYYEQNKDTMSDIELQKFVQSKGFNLIVSEDGVRTLSYGNQNHGNVAEFLVTPGYTNAAVKNLIKDNDDPDTGGLQRLDKDISKSLRQISNEAWTTINRGKYESEKPTSRTALLFTNNNPRLYKGLLWMPIRGGAVKILNSMNSKGPLKEPYTKEDVMGRSQRGSGNRYIESSISELNG